MSIHTDDMIWKALADPTRRLLLGFLRESPKTTGDICAKVPKLTRFAIMKHLNILENAGLILIKRKGKFRWNYLNATPIQNIYQRWVKPYEAHWAESALALKNLVESKGENDMADLQSIEVNLEIQINASKTKVWRAITEEIGKWWLKDFYAVANSEIILEAQVGGRLYEKNDAGASGLWYTITNIDPEKSIAFSGHLRPEFGGPATSLLKLSLVEKGDITTLQISDALFGAVNENSRKNIDEGWKLLFTDGLKQYLEG